MIDARLTLGYSQQQLADLLGVRRDTVARWESGRDPVPYRVPGELHDFAAFRRAEIAVFFGV